MLTLFQCRLVGFFVGFLFKVHMAMVPCVFAVGCNREGCVPSLCLALVCAGTIFVPFRRRLFSTMATFKSVDPSGQSFNSTLLRVKDAAASVAFYVRVGGVCV